MSGIVKGENKEKEKGAGQGWADLGIGDITVDSAADESCWPIGGAFETRPSKKNIILKAANGGKMGH